MSHKSWVFTINNYTDDEIKYVQLLSRVHPVTRMVVGKELGEGGTPHLQGAVTLKSSIRMSALKEDLGGRAHLEPMRALGGDKAFDYCRKEGNVIVDIDNRVQGKRTDIDAACKALLEGGMTKLIEEHAGAFVKYATGFEKLNFRLSRPRQEPPRVWWLHGPTGSGKTRLVHTLEQPENLWVSGDDLRWFDGYNGHEAACFDDFRGDMCRLRWLLRLLDRYPCRVQIKGGHAEWIPRRIYITSAKSPTDAYACEDEKLDQLTRRITRVFDTSVPGWDALVQHLGAQ